MTLKVRRCLRKSHFPVCALMTRHRWAKEVIPHLLIILCIRRGASFLRSFEVVNERGHDFCGKSWNVFDNHPSKQCSWSWKLRFHFRFSRWSRATLEHCFVESVGFSQRTHSCFDGENGFLRLNRDFWDENTIVLACNKVREDRRSVRAQAMASEDDLFLHNVDD